MNDKDKVRRVFIEKREGFNKEAESLLNEVANVLHIRGVSGARVINRYDIQGLRADEYGRACAEALSSAAADAVYHESVDIDAADFAFAVESLPGQYDQRADLAAQCIAALLGCDEPIVRHAKVIVLSGALGGDDTARVKRYFINPIECGEAGFEKPETLLRRYPHARDVLSVTGFISMNGAELNKLQADLGLVLSTDDLKLCQAYFRDSERRDPSFAELRVIDTYWSDHCRHATFLTDLKDIRIEAGCVAEAFDEYKKAYRELYGNDPEKMGRDRVTLMDVATIAAKKLRAEGRLDDLDASEEVNACSFTAAVDVGGEEREYLIMFKNETHNHPTEIEPFGGAATCLGGAIRDPMSGRAYVYQAMRITGCADPRGDAAATIKGKLPQRVITRSAAAGYSSYGSQIGVPAGYVREIYHPGYAAKRMELGAVIGAAPKDAVRRQRPEAGDSIILLGGRTGRDGIGGATGSSKAQDEKSLLTCGAEVQKGNPLIERRIQRLFRKPEATRLIKRCNDFGAGGVAVAVVELAPGVTIDLDKVPLKYEGLDGVDIAISESQERMAVVVGGRDAADFIRMAGDEGIEATVIAEVGDSERVLMYWRGAAICDISRKFLDTNGAGRSAAARIPAPDLREVRKCVGFGSDITVRAPEPEKTDCEPVRENPDCALNPENTDYAPEPDKNIRTPEHEKPDSGRRAADTESVFLSKLEDLNVCSQKGLAELFDCTAGGNASLSPYGGKYARTPVEGMAAGVPVPGGVSATSTVMSHGYDPYLSSVSQFHGGYYAVVESLAKMAALGAYSDKIKLSFQEYFEKPGDSDTRWGKPLAALLGAFRAQTDFGVAAIGGKDSMSGSFGDLDVPPALVSFAVGVAGYGDLITPEFKRAGSDVVLLATERDKANPESGLIDAAALKKSYLELRRAARDGKILSAYPVTTGGIAAAAAKMCFGNGVGIEMSPEIADLYTPLYGSIVLELSPGATAAQVFTDAPTIFLGKTIPEPVIKIGGAAIPSETALNAWEKPLEGVFPINGAGGARRDISPACVERRGISPACDAQRDGTSAGCEPRDVISTCDMQCDISPACGERRDASPNRDTRRRAATPFAKPRVMLLATPGVNGEYETAYAFERAGAIANTVYVNNNGKSDIAESVEKVRKAILDSNIIVLPGGCCPEPDGSGKIAAAFLRNAVIAEAIEYFLKIKGGLMLGIGDGFCALVRLGLLPGGAISAPSPGGPVLAANASGRYVSAPTNIAVCANNSPWLSFASEGECYASAFSHAEGRFFADPEQIAGLERNMQIATRYVDPDGRPAIGEPYNPAGSTHAIEGIVSRDGRIFGKMGHPERVGRGVLKNIGGSREFRAFESGVAFFM